MEFIVLASIAAHHSCARNDTELTQTSVLKAARKQIKHDVSVSYELLPNLRIITDVSVHFSPSGRPPSAAVFPVSL